MPRGGENARNTPKDGPKVSTPLSERFYAAWQGSGRTLESLGRAVGLSTAAVGAYLNGTRGGDGQRRSIENLEMLGGELDIDIDEVHDLLGVSVKDGIVTAIEMDATLSRGQKAVLKALLREYRGR